jgi:hypothetical protein
MAYITKTDYVLWRECPKNAWLKLHRPDIYNATQLTEFEQSVIDAGIEAEIVARKVFRGGFHVTGSKSDAQQETSELIDLKTPTLFQSVFENEGLLAAVDVLEFDGATSEYAVHEIKSSTRVRDEHLYDLAFQVVLLRKTARKVGRACLLHLNPHYIRQDELDLGQLFVSVDATSQVNEIAERVEAEMLDARNYLLADTEPKGPCSCLYKGRSRHCTTFQYSNPEIPEYCVHDITRIGNRPEMLKQLVDAGIMTLDKIPPDIKLTEPQKIQVQVYRSGETILDKEAIIREFGDLSYPLHFIDYETYAPALPSFKGFGPYQPIPLQYSLDIVGSPGEDPIHCDFLHSGLDDPTQSFLDSLKQNVGNFGAIVVWNKSFESQVNDLIARRVPQARDYLAEVNDRMYDLKDVFAQQYFVHRDLLGKISVKRVLPVLAPKLTYSNLTIQNGAAASLAWSQLLSDELTDKERVELSRQLREYCALDSYGMVAIWRALLGLVDG